MPGKNKNNSIDEQLSIVRKMMKDFDIVNGPAADFDEMVKLEKELQHFKFAEEDRKIWKKKPKLNYSKYNKHKHYSIPEKIEFFEHRIHDSDLTIKQREYALKRLDELRFESSFISYKQNRNDKRADVYLSRMKKSRFFKNIVKNY